MNLILQFLKKNKIDLVILLSFIFFITMSFVIPFEPGKKITANFTGFLMEMITFIPLIFILIGLFDVWVPKEKIQKHIGEGSSHWGIVWVILLAMLQAGPLYGAFPVTYLLWKKGASIRNIFIYLGAFSTLKIPMLGFEIAFLGIEFTLLRSLISLPIFIAIGFIMENILKNTGFEVKSPQ